MHKLSLIWFRQDLRVYDNTALFEAVTSSENIIPIFILDKHLIPDFGGIEDQKFGFLREALDHLSKEIEKNGGKKLEVFHDYPEEIIPKLVETYQIEKVFTNRAYDSYGKKRDRKIAEKLAEMQVDFEDYKDFLLVEPEEVKTMKVFTPFYKRWQKKLCHSGLEEVNGACSRDATLGYPESNDKILNQVQDDNHCHELEIPKISQFEIEEGNQAKDFIQMEKHPYYTIDFGKDRFENHINAHYDEYRNNLSIDGTSRLSIYLRFGIFSVRQIYNKTLIPNPSPSREKGKSEMNKNVVSFSMKGEGIQGGGLSYFISELAWREFWHHIFYHFPFTTDTEFLEKRRNIEWSHDEYLFEKWCQGETGYPVVDAAMKQLNQTNWMHGRARMIVASFLTKDLHIDWRWGEKYFKEKLLDYDEAVNLGNWQWSASVGADPKPLRIFNPILQSEKFDTDAKYIQKFLPELLHQNKKSIHNPLENDLQYIRTIVDHRVETKKTREIYKKADSRD